MESNRQCLWHRNNGDFCEALKYDTLTFALDRVVGDGGDLYINIDGYMEMLLYR